MRSCTMYSVRNKVAVVAMCLTAVAAYTLQAPSVKLWPPAQPGAAGVQAVQTGAGRQLVCH